MKGCFTKIIGFIIIIFILYKFVSCLLGVELEDADEEYMTGLWIAKYVLSEEINEYEYITVYNIALCLNGYNKLGYSIFTYDSALNIPKGNMINMWKNNILNAIDNSTNNNVNIWKIKNKRLILNISGKEYKSGEKIKKADVFFIKNLLLMYDYNNKFKFKGNFLKFIDKDGNKMDYKDNPIASGMEEWILGDVDIY